MITPEMEDYLKAIYSLEQSSEEKVRTSKIADRIGVKPPTVASMLENLEKRGFIEREKYAGVELTDEGRKVALEIIRHHRLLEVYLTEHLNYTWSEVHDEADKLEHHISEEFESRVADILGNPEFDPHGAPIPSEELEQPEIDDFSDLGEFEEGDTVVVEMVSDEDSEILDYLGEHGINPGSELVIDEIKPIGLINIESDGVQVSLPRNAARRVLVSPKI